MRKRAADPSDVEAQGGLSSIMASAEKLLAKSGVPTRASQGTRVDQYIDAAASFSDGKVPKLAAALRAFKPIINMAIHILIFLLPIWKAIYMAVFKFLSMLPHNILMMVFGIALCFFGGVYTASISAIEAFRSMGGERALDDCKYIWKEIQHVMADSAIDDAKDDDGDGVADVDQMDGKQLLARKVNMSMKCITEPEKLQAAVGSLWAAWMAVLATLRLEFARTTALALGICEMVKFPIVRYLAAPISWLLGPDRKHWTLTIIDVTLKVICITIAWYIQSIISAFYSGIRGAKMFASGAFDVMRQHGILKKFPDFLVPDKDPFNPDTTYVDEIISYPLAAAGFYWQLTSGFSSAAMFPFPANVAAPFVFFPLDVVEWMLKICISWQSSSDVPH